MTQKEVAHIDDDENVKMMRETARTIGLTKSLLRIHIASLRVLEVSPETELLRDEIAVATGYSV